MKTGWQNCEAAECGTIWGRSWKNEFDDFSKSSKRLREFVWVTKTKKIRGTSYEACVLDTNHIIESDTILIAVTPKRCVGIFVKIILSFINRYYKRRDRAHLREEAAEVVSAANRGLEESRAHKRLAAYFC